MSDIKKQIQQRDPKWNKRLDYKKGDLFWNDSDKFVIVTKNGFRSAFTPKELIEIERHELNKNKL